MSNEDPPPPRLDPKLLSGWFRGGGVRGGHDGLDILEQNWDKAAFTPVEQLRLHAEIARRSIADRVIDPGDVSDIQVRRLQVINRALRDLGQTEERIHG